MTAYRLCAGAARMFMIQKSIFNTTCLFSEACKVKIWNNGKGIPIVEHKDEKMYIPTMIFGHLLTSSNYDDTEKKVTGERERGEMGKDNNI